MRLAITGGTGFVGSHVIEAALAAGHEVRALTRREQPPRERLGVDARQPRRPRRARSAWSTDADAIIHVAGVINAPDAAGFELGNVAGTLAMLAAATAGGVRRFVHVSSLAAREPALSLYGASKARAEELVESCGLDWAIVRPPAVYGPGDKETLELFRMARRGLVLLPPRGRVSLIHVADLARLLLALTARGTPKRRVIEPDDGTPGGWSHKAFAQGAGAGGRPPHRQPVDAASAAPARRPDRPPGPPRPRQADPRPRRLLQPPRLGRDLRPLPAARAVAPADRDQPGPRRHRPLVRGARLALAVG